jgi:protein O-mannosyl-transferase
MTEVHKKNNFFNQKRYSAIIIFIVAFAVYANILHNQFTNWDDVALIVNNQQIRSLDFENIKKIFDYSPRGTYQPVRVFSYAIDYHFWKLNPVGYHIHNMLLHALAAVILYLGLLQIIPMIRGMEQAEDLIVQFSALLTALIFAVHPVNVEAVTWLSGRKYVLLSFFSFISLSLFAANFKKNKLNLWMITGAVFFAVLAALSSPFGVALPFFFLACCFSWDKSNNPVKVMVRHKNKWLPFCVFFIPVFIQLWSVLVKGRFGSTASVSIFDNHFYLLWTMLRVCFDYVRNIFFPFWLNIRYPDFVSTSFMEYKIITAMTAIAAIAVMIFRNFKKGDKKLFFCISWFVLFWLPASNIIPISTKMADRYIYIALPGLVLLVSLYIFQFLEVVKKKGKLPGVIVSIIIVSVFACYFLPFTVIRNRVWKDSGTLWSASLKTYPDNAIAHNNLGVHLLYIMDKPEEAEVHFREAIRLKPESTEPYENLFDAFLSQSKYIEAANCGKKLILMRSGDAEWYYKTGSAFAAAGKYDASLEYYDKAIELEPHYTDAFYNTGVSFSALGLVKQAEQNYKKTLEIDPNYLKALNNLGSLLIAQEKYDEAEILLGTALKSEKEDINTCFNLGIVYSFKKKSDLAVKYFLKVVNFNPDDAVAHFLVGKELLKLGKKNDGNKHIMKARQLEPDNNKFY